MSSFSSLLMSFSTSIAISLLNMLGIFAIVEAICKSFPIVVLCILRPSLVGRGSLVQARFPVPLDLHIIVKSDSIDVEFRVPWIRNILPQIYGPKSDHADKGFRCLWPALSKGGGHRLVHGSQSRCVTAQPRPPRFVKVVGSR